MDGYEVKKVMDQVHISSEMQEEVIMNIQRRMEHGNKNTKRMELAKDSYGSGSVRFGGGRSQFSGAGVRGKRGTGENGERSRGGNERSKRYGPVAA